MNIIGSKFSKNKPNGILICIILIVYSKIDLRNEIYVHTFNLFKNAEKHEHIL